MSTKTLFMASVLSAFLLFMATELCSAGTSELLVQAESYIEQGKYEQAEAIYQQIVKDFPGTDEALDSLARKFQNEKKLLLKLHGARLCYYGFHEAGKSKKFLLPVWHFALEKDGRVYHKYVNAHSNRALNFELNITTALQKRKK